MSTPIWSVSAAILCERAILSDVLPKLSVPAIRRALCDASSRCQYKSTKETVVILLIKDNSIQVIMYVTLLNKQIELMYLKLITIIKWIVKRVRAVGL